VEARERHRGRSRSARTDVDRPSLLARIDRALCRLDASRARPLQPLGDGADPDAVLRDCAAALHAAHGLMLELRDAVVEQVGPVQTDRLRCALEAVELALSR
jgi:hypothetical protein